MSIVVGSARHDEHGNCYKNGCAGDQLQTKTDDYGGEVSMQAFYVHSKGWYVLRAKDDDVANRIALLMVNACNNEHIGYDQNQRSTIWNYGIGTQTNCECDCSSLMRQVIKEASGVDVGNFTTGTEKSALIKSGLFVDMGAYTLSMALYQGDILVTKTAGHTVAVCYGGVARNGAGNQANKPVVAKPTIKKGSKGIEVKKLQQDLNYVLGCSLTVDGDAGTKTDAQIRTFQKKYGLSVDGIYGKNSYAKMNSII